MNLYFPRESAKKVRGVLPVRKEMKIQIEFQTRLRVWYGGQSTGLSEEMVKLRWHHFLTACLDIC